MTAIQEVAEKVYAATAKSGSTPDSLELDIDLFAALQTELQSSQKYLDQGYVVADGPVDWTDFRFMGVRMLPISETSTVT